MRNPFRRRLTELERFVAYLDSESSVSYGGDAFSVAQRENEREVAVGIVGFSRDPHFELVTVEDLVAAAAPDHEGYGYDRREVDNWVSRFREQDQD
jgi:hypothetical protein